MKKSSTIIIAAMLTCSLAFAADNTTKDDGPQKIWDQNYAAFTDLINYNGNLYVAFREGNGHTTRSKDPFYGQARIMKSTNKGKTWQSVALIKECGKDLRDPKLSIMPDGRLMVNMGCTWNHDGNIYRRQPHVAFSKDGENWTQALPCLLTGKDVSYMDWLWRVVWHKGVAYSVSYQRGINKLILFKSTDGIIWEQLTLLKTEGFANETAIQFDGDEMILLVREEKHKDFGLSHLGKALPPYTDWQWINTDLRLGGPCFLIMPDGNYLVGSRDYQESQLGCALFSMTPEGKTKRLYRFEAGKDCSYTGLVMENETLYVSYYSSHDGGIGNIYFQTLPVEPLLNGQLYEQFRKSNQPK